MALVPKSTYKGKIVGRRTATIAEQGRYGKTTFAPNSGHKIKPEGNVVIMFTQEYWHPVKRTWILCTKRNSQAAKSNEPVPCIYQWNFRTLQAAIDYITGFMHKVPNAEPVGKDKTKEYHLSPKGYWRDGKFYQYDNPNWDWKGDYGYTFFSQWIVKGGRYLRRYTFEQHKDLTFMEYDYHAPKPSPWSGHYIQKSSSTIKLDEEEQERYRQHSIERFGIDLGIKEQKQVSSNTRRSFFEDDEPDTTQQKNLAYRKEKRAIQRLYEEEDRYTRNMTPKEYRDYQHDMRYMTDEEWGQKYGVDHSYYND